MSVLATDDFNRADSSSLGANWAVAQGDGAGFAIASNACVIESSSGNYRGSYYSAVSAPNDQYSQALITQLSNVAQGVTVRMITSGGVRNYYAAGFNANEFGGGSRIWKCVAGVFTSLATGSTSLAAGQTWYLEIQGTNLVFKINGATECTASDASLSSGQFGLMGAHSGAANYSVFDDWAGGDFAAAGGLPFFMQQDLLAGGMSELVGGMQ